MDVIASPEDAEQVVHVDARTLRRMCRDGDIKHACKVGGRWRINLTAEYPEIMGREGNHGLDGTDGA